MIFRSYRPGDEAALVRLFQTVFGRAVTTEWWRWKLLGRPGAVERVMLAEDDGELVFQVGGIPCPARIEGRPATMMVAVDAMTRPDRRGRGLLGDAYRRLFPRWREQGVDLVLGLPNERAWFRDDVLGWIPLFPLRWRVRLLLPERIAARRTGIRALARFALAGRLWNRWWDRGRGRTDLELSDEIPPPPEVDALWERCAADAPNGLVRNAAWIGWRYLETPERAYRTLGARSSRGLEGLLVYHVREEDGRRVGFIAEILAPRARRDVAEALIRGLIARLRQEGAELVATLVTDGSEREAVLARLGFLRSWGAFTVGCVPLREGLDVRGLLTPASWALEGGCFDVV